MSFTSLCTKCKLVSYQLTWFRSNSNTASICRMQRSKYPRRYPTLIVNPDGSSYTVRYHEPRQIIKLPLNMDKLSEQEQLRVLANRKPLRKLAEMAKELDGDTFRADTYLKIFK